MKLFRVWDIGEEGYTVVIANTPEEAEKVYESSDPGYTIACKKYPPDVLADLDDKTPRCVLSEGE